MTSRCFPAPRHADKMPGGHVVRDANGQALAYLYSRDDPTEALQAKMLTLDEARRIAIKHRAVVGAIREGRAVSGSIAPACIVCKRPPGSALTDRAAARPVGSPH